MIQGQSRSLRGITHFHSNILSKEARIQTMLLRIAKRVDRSPQSAAMIWRFIEKGLQRSTQKPLSLSLFGNKSTPEHAVLVDHFLYSLRSIFDVSGHSAIVDNIERRRVDAHHEISTIFSGITLG